MITMRVVSTSFKNKFDKKIKELELENAELKEQLKNISPTNNGDNKKKKVAEVELNRLYTAINSISDFVAMTDAEGRMFYMNEAFKEAMAIKVEEDISDYPSKKFYSEKSFKILQKKILPKVIKNGFWKGEIELKSINQEKISVSHVILCKRDETDKVEYFTSISRDVSDLVKAKKELETQTIELQRSNKDLEMFAYAASHDLQEPLRTVASYINLLERKLGNNLSKDMSLFMYYASDGVKRMQHLINDLLEYSRLGKNEKPFELVDIGKVIIMAKSNLSSLISDTSAEIVFGEMPVIHANQSQMLSLFQNLIENGIKFRKDNEKPLITINCKQYKTKTQFIIKDNGFGINNKYYDKIFTIFQRLNSRKKHDGTGIGLAVCKKIVERHGGKICVKSEIGRGTSFIFEIKL